MSPSPDHASGTRNDPEALNPMRFLSGGIEFAVTCAAGALLGRWIDGRLHTDPWFTVVLLVLAFASGTWMLLRGLVVTDEAGHDAGAGSKTQGGSAK